jgi:hypothetical protein
MVFARPIILSDGFRDVHQSWWRSSGNTTVTPFGVLAEVSLRHVTVSNTLLINDNEPTELVTALRRHRLTENLNSEWWEFSISSHNGHVWTKHCSDEVRAESSKKIAEH